MDTAADNARIHHPSSRKNLFCPADAGSVQTMHHVSRAQKL